MRRLPASLLLCATLLRADFEASRWRFRKPVEVPSAGLCSVVIDREIFAASSPGLADTRLVAAGAEVARVLEPGERQVVAQAAPARTEDREARASILVIDLGAPNLPHDRLRIESPAAYFYRDAELGAGENGNVWIPVLRRPLYRLPAGEGLELPFAERHDRFLRLRIFNGDDLPIEVRRVTVDGFGRRARFIARAPGRHWLYYGNPAAREPVYDLARVLEQQPSNPGIVVTAGAQEVNPDYRDPDPPFEPWTERHPELLYITLTGAVAGLGYILLRFRRTVSNRE